MAKTALIKKSTVHKFTYHSLVEWVSLHRLEFVSLVIILLVGALLRFCKIADYMTFLGDEGRDAIVVRRFLVNFDPILIGPGTSIGNMYLGPLYYYLMAPALLVFNFSPVGPAIMIAALGVATVFLVWQLARELFPQTNSGVHLGAFLGGILYAISSTVVHFSRSSWNPNIMPFFSLLCMYAIWRVWSRMQHKWLIVLGISLAFVLQSHYLGLLLVPVLFSFWVLTFLKVKNQKAHRQDFLRKSVLGIAIFFLLMSPLLIFDARHDWLNFNSMKVFFTERQTTVSARPWTGLPKIPEMFSQILTSLLAGNNKVVGTASAFLLSIATIFTFGYLVRSKKVVKENFFRPLVLLITWAFFGILGLALYKQHIYDHYFGFLFPVPFLMLAGIFQLVENRKKYLGALLAVPVVISLGYVNFLDMWFWKAPGKQLQRSINVAEKMIEISDGEKFNMATIAERNYEGAYQYFLEKEGANFVMIDPQREKETVAKQLFVVCEMPREKCDPTTNPKAGIANFGWSKIDMEWQVSGVTLFRLVHSVPSN